MMKQISVSSYQELSRLAADLLASQVRLKPDCVLGLATGSTPIGTYQSLVQDYQAGRLDFSQVTSFNLDEYLGLSPDHPQSYRAFMEKNLFSHINLDPSRSHVPNGCATDPQAECAAYDQAIAQAGGIDLQLLGIGANGHIAFNEPGDAFIRDTHLTHLTKDTIQANKRFFRSEAEVPTQAITMGVGWILRARKVLLLAEGKHKKQALDAALHGPICPQMPASLLQLHPDLTVIAHLED